MSDPPNGERDASGEETAGARLDSWKEIATYLGRSERTVRRWEHTTGLPIRRLPHKRASVYAFRSELDAWWHRNGLKLEPSEPPSAKLTNRSVSPKRRAALVAVISGVAAFVVSPFWREVPPRSPLFSQLTFHAGNTTFPAVSRDRKLLAFASDRGDDQASDIWVQPIAGGQAVRITHHGSTNRHLDFSPDGSTIAFRSELDGGGIYLAAVNGGGIRKLAAGGYHPRYSPDGKQLSIAGRPALLPAKLGEPEIVVPKFDLIGGPALWSKDGKRLLFLGAPDAAHRAPSEVDWWVVAPDGSGPVRTGVSLALGRQGVGSIGNGVFPMDWDDHWALFSMQSGQGTNIWRIPLSARTGTVSGAAQQITFGPAASSARFLSDSQIVFVNDFGITHIWSAPFDPNKGLLLGEPRQLTRDVSLIAEHRGVFPQLSADGNKMFLVSHRSGEADVWRQDLRTGAESALQVSPRPDEPILVSADGSGVAFSSSEGSDRTIYVADISAGATRKICERCGVLMDRSADGRRMLFGSGSPQRISSLMVEDGQIYELAKDAQQSLRNAVFSPDGSWLTWEVGEKIVVARFLNKKQLAANPIVVAHTIDSNGYPKWSPDGNLIYFLSKDNGNRCLWAQRVDPATKAPHGEPIRVWCPYESSRKIWTIAPFSISRNRLAMPLTEGRANIWMAEWE
jgi:Tol biopolymer transport system component